MGMILFTSCNNNSTNTAPEKIKTKDFTPKKTLDIDDLADAKLDEENPEHEKSKLFFLTSKSVKEGFENEIKGLKKIESQTINGNVKFELYKQGGNQEGPEWNFKAVIRIGDYYLPIRLGIDHSIRIQDLVYNDKMQEIIINTGCFSDAGCLDKSLVVRTFKMRPFTLTDFGESNIYFTDKDLYGYSFPEYKQKLEDVLESKQLVVINFDDSHLVMQSFIPYKMGFAKGSFTKKVTVEIAG